MGKIFLQINSAAVAFIDILIAAWEGLTGRKPRFIVTWLKYDRGKLQVNFS